MTTSFETQVKNVGEGDQIIIPALGERMLVRRAEPCPGGSIRLTCLDRDGDVQPFYFDPDEPIKVVDA